jgi:hypothetical protein
VDLSSLGAASAGVWTRPQALELLGRGQVDRFLDDRVWQTCFTGVIHDGGSELSAVQWGFAAVLASGGADQPVPFGPSGGTRLRAVACGRTAARIWGFPLIDDDDPATGGNEKYVHDVHTWRALRALRVPARRDEPRGLELRRHRLHLLPAEVVRLESGLWLTSRLRTAVDCVRLLSHEAAVCLLDHALHHGSIALPQLMAAHEARAGWPEVQALGAAIAAADGRSESPGETLARLLLKPVLPGLVPQVELLGPYGATLARFDLGDEEIRLVVDMDGKRAHAGELMVAKDRRRDRMTGGYGWWTERGTWYDVRRRQADFIARIVERDAILRRRSA